MRKTCRVRQALPLYPASWILRRGQRPPARPRSRHGLPV